MKKKAFTLIELIAVLVILAILALIVTPLVMNIIRKAKIAADRRSIDAYGRSVELAISSYLMDTGTFPTDLSTLNVEYTGSTVICNVMSMKENGGLYLSECTVNNKDVKDSQADDGWYHYGTRDLTNEEYVDMYGDALKTASLAYYTANNQIVSDYTTLTVDYTGKPVTCDVTVNYDGTIYMTNCKVNNVSITSATEEDGYYHYGKLKKYIYNIGDEITYNNMDFYVIKNSGATDDTLTLLKAEPLSYDEVVEYGNSFVHYYLGGSIQSGVSNHNNYGYIMYDGSSKCSASSSYGGTAARSVVENWVNDKIDVNDLEYESQGFKGRLLTANELVDNLGCSNDNCSNSYAWLTTNDYSYFTMSQSTCSSYGSTCPTVYMIENGYGNYRLIAGDTVSSSPYNGAVRPVITIKKSALN